LAGASNNTSIGVTIIKSTSKASKRISFSRGIISLIEVFSSGKSLIYIWFLEPNSELSKPIL
jgi:hypothetical protein